MLGVSLQYHILATSPEFLEALESHKFKRVTVMQTGSLATIQLPRPPNLRTYYELTKARVCICVSVFCFVFHKSKLNCPNHIFGEKLDVRLLFVTYYRFENCTKLLLERNIIKRLGNLLTFGNYNQSFVSSRTIFFSYKLFTKELY